MDRILVAGIETVVGAHFAAILSQRFPVTGVSFRNAIPIVDCETTVCSSVELDAIRQCFAQARPQRVVYCGPAAVSSWIGTEPDLSQAVRHARHWAMIAAEADCRLTYISSDAVFTGPWMFHAETCDSFCSSPEATTLRRIEEEIARISPNALLLRVNAFGWQPAAAGVGWLESLLDELDDGRVRPIDCIRHASPIHAADLVDIAHRAWQAGLDGLYHVGGAERVNPFQFVERLAAEFHRPAPRRSTIESLTTRASGFGAGETSLQTRKIRRALGISMPLLSDGLRRLYQQTFDGFRDRLNAGSLLHEKVA